MIKDWINIKEQLPEAKKWVWVYHRNGYQTKGYFKLQNEFGLLWRISGSELCSYGAVTHWMELPDDPIEFHLCPHCRTKTTNMNYEGYCSQSCFDGI